MSVVVPARNCPDQLRYCLRRLDASTSRDFEVIVADDASTDETGAVAAEFGAAVVRLETRAGPAGARNRGAELAAGDILYFVDADTGVHPGNIAAVQQAFDEDPTLDALFGSYDVNPTEPGFLTQYRNLFHHFVHQQGQEEASTFWSGCGAIRRKVFFDHGGFDPGLYDRPAIEDIELGARLVKGGRRIAVKKHIQVTHLKRWTLRDMVKTDVFDRGIPWTRLILREKKLPNDLNVSVKQRVSLVLTYLLLGVFVVGAWYQPWLLMVPVGVGAAVIGFDRWTRSRKESAAMRLVGSLLALAAAAWVALASPLWTAVSAGLVLVIVALNRSVYAFFLRERGPFFTVAVVPLQIFYFLYSGVAFMAGLALHLLYDRRAPPSGEGAHTL